MRQETYNKLETIIHSLHEFRDMLDDEAEHSACKTTGGLPGDIYRVTDVISRIINDLITTRDHMHKVEQLEKLNEKFQTSFPKTTGPAPESKTVVASKTVKELMENPNVSKIYVPEDKAKELGVLQECIPMGDRL